MSKTLKKLNHVLEQLDELANHFEGLGLEDQSGLLDEAAEAVSEIRGHRCEPLKCMGYLDAPQSHLEARGGGSIQRLL